MNTNLPFEYRDLYHSIQQQQQHHQQPLQSDTPPAHADQLLDSVMSEPDLLRAYRLDPYTANVDNPSSQAPSQHTRLSDNSISWASMNSSPLSHNLYTGFPAQLLSPEQFPYSTPYHNSTMGHSLTIPTTELASIERQSLALAANQRAAREARIAASLTPQPEPPAKSATLPYKSTGTVTRKPVEGECPVCWEAFLDAQVILFCKTTCGHNFHKSCIVEWLTAPANRQELLKCPMCRGAWDDQELRELHRENGISSPRPAKRFRADPTWAARQQRQEHMRRITRQRVYERRNSAERPRATPAMYDHRSNLFVPDEQSRQMSPVSPTSTPNQFSPSMPYRQPTSSSFAPMPRTVQGLTQPTVPSGGSSSLQVSTHAQPTAFGVSQFMPSPSNSNSNGLRPAQMVPLQFQPPQAISTFPAQPGQAHPMYHQNYQPANLGMSQFGPASHNHPQGTRTPATPIMRNSALSAPQHPCPAMRQQNIAMQQQVYPGSFASQPPSSNSQSLWEYHQYHYSQTYTTVYMNH